MDSCESGILTSNISDHFFVFVFLDTVKMSQILNYTKKNNFTLKNKKITINMGSYRSH